MKDSYNFEDMRFAYIAGLFDGEGSIGIYTHGPYLHGHLRIKIDSTDLTPIRYVTNVLGGYIMPRKPTSKRHKVCYMWRLNGAPAAEALEKLLPYLIIKKERALLGILISKMHELNKRGNA